MLSPERIIVYRSQAEQAQDDFFFGGGMFEDGLITKYIGLDLLLFLIAVGVIIILVSHFNKKRW